MAGRPRANGVALGTVRVNEELAYWVENHPLGKNVLVEQALRDLKATMAVEDQVRLEVDAEVEATRAEIEARVRADVLSRVKADSTPGTDGTDATSAIPRR